MELYERIKSRREELNMTQDELAKKMGYTSRSTIAKIESGKNDIPQSKIKAFAKALKTTPAYLMGWLDVNDNWLGDGRTAEQDFANSPGKFIEATRKTNGMSQEELADKAGISISLLDSLEAGFERDILMSDLRKIAKVFNIDPYEIAGFATIIVDDVKSQEPQNEPMRAIARAGENMSFEDALELKKLAERLYPDAFKKKDTK